MPGVRVLSVLDMQQNTFFKTHQKAYRSSGKSAAAKDLQKHPKRAKRTREPSTPENKPIQKGVRAVASLPGNLIHLSQSADGKLRWLPPSSSSSSSFNECTTFSGCFSEGDCVPLANVGPALILSSRKHEKEKSSDAADPASPSLISCCRNQIASDSSIIHSSEIVNGSDVQEASFGSHHMVQASSELSFSSQKQAAPGGGKKMMASRSCGLSPYLSSKLKPGKHILGVKKQQVFIRPGQLRHWAVGNSPSLATNLSNLPATSLKGKACRNLAF